MSNVRYIWLKPEAALPNLAETQPFRAVIVIEADVTPEWQTLVSEWLVGSGCLYAVAWGRNCGSWDNSVDLANLAEFDYGEIPDDKFVMTTWHDDEPLSEAFWFASHVAMHPMRDLSKTLVVDVAPHPREAAMIAAFADATKPA